MLKLLTEFVALTENNKFLAVSGFLSIILVWLLRWYRFNDWKLWRYSLYTLASSYLVGVGIPTSIVLILYPFLDNLPKINLWIPPLAGIVILKAAFETLYSAFEKKSQKY